jgi:hypothetical protein
VESDVEDDVAAVYPPALMALRSAEEKDVGVDRKKPFDGELSLVMHTKLESTSTVMSPRLLTSTTEES